MRKLVLSKRVFRDICAIVGETRNDCETGVALFGACVRRHVSRGSYAEESWPSLTRYEYVVLTVAGPGPQATHEPASYSHDADYASAIYQALRTALPSIEWLGELHVHPRDMTWLSGGDQRTVRDLLSSTAKDTVCPREFIAGVMQRRKNEVEIYPYYFSRRRHEGYKMQVEYVPHDADVVRQARELASENPVILQERECPGEEKGSTSPACQGWLAKVVNTLRRKTNDN